ncbi:hypothetical protein [Sporisorium scitamineum]|nr:hypothetical protein [Sporisorium scitamineum]
MVEQPQDSCLPSDNSQLDVEDLGSIQATLEESGKTIHAAAIPPHPQAASKLAGLPSKASSFPAVLTPEIKKIWTRKYKLVVPADLRRVLQEWNEAFVIIKTEVIDCVNKVRDAKELDKLGLELELANGESNFCQ